MRQDVHMGVGVFVCGVVVCMSMRVGMRYSGFVLSAMVQFMY